MRVKVFVTASGNVTSVACVSLATFRSLNATWGSYVSLQCCEDHRARVFRLEIDEKWTDKGVRIDHWPSSCSVENKASQSHCNNILTHEVQVDLHCIIPLDVRVVQYVALAPAARNNQLKLALAFVKSLLRGRVLTGQTGMLTLQRDGINYGDWTYEAYFRGRGGQKDDQVVGTIDGGVVTDQTLVLIFPSATSSIVSLLHLEQRYQPIGSHARGFRELAAMALMSRGGPDDLEQTFAVPHSLLLHAPSGAGKTTLVHQIAKELDANLLVLDGGLLAAPQLRLEDFFAAALRIQPCVLLMEDLELLFPMTLDETKYKLVCRLVNCLESIRKRLFTIA